MSDEKTLAEFLEIKENLFNGVCLHEGLTAETILAEIREGYTRLAKAVENSETKTLRPLALTLAWSTLRYRVCRYPEGSKPVAAGYTMSTLRSYREVRDWTEALGREIAHLEQRDALKLPNQAGAHRIVSGALTVAYCGYRYENRSSNLRHGQQIQNCSKEPE